MLLCSTLDHHLFFSNVYISFFYRLYSLHILNHVISARRIVTNTNRRLRRLAREQGEVRAAEAERGKGRARKIKNRTKIAPKKLKQEQDPNDIRQDIDGIPTPIRIGDDGDEDKSEDWKRDQGYTRPIVLILCPMRYGLAILISKCNYIYRGVHRVRVRDRLAIQ